jgi:catechol 2,3-dioxygenase-like lactoylglutathione lyase family enzyme
MSPISGHRIHRITQEAPVQIRLASVMVDDQNKALRFYTTILGFVKNKDIPMGPFRWLTVSSPEGAEGVELVLEPMGFEPAQTYQKALFAAGIPATAFLTNDIASEHRRLQKLGVRFRGEPTSMGPIIAVLFEDTCGNLINLVQPTT